MNIPLLFYSQPNDSYSVSGVLTKAGPTARLLAFGKGAHRQRTPAVCRELRPAESITCTGSIDEARKNDLLAQARVGRLVLYEEGWRLNVIKGGDMSTPSVAYPVAGLVYSTVHNKAGVVAVTNGMRGRLQDPAVCQQLRQNTWRPVQEQRWIRGLPKADDRLDQQRKEAFDTR